MTIPNRHSLTFGLLCAFVGSLVAVLVLLPAEGTDWWSFLPFAAPAAGFVAGAAFWRILPERLAHRRPLWGAVAGGLTGTVGHFLTWYLGFVGSNLCHWLTGGCTDSLGEPPANLLQAFPGAAALTLFSLVVVGWLTLPIGAALGWIFARRTG